jgi:hypothetical protein
MMEKNKRGVAVLIALKGVEWQPTCSVVIRVEMTCSGSDEKVKIQGSSFHVVQLQVRVGCTHACPDGACPVETTSARVSDLETSSGKKRFSHLIHKLNAIRHGNLVVNNSAAIPKQIAEHHLFGYVTGTVTVADADMPKAFQDASSSLVLLGEIGELQSKLLRVVEEDEVQRVGGAAPIELMLRKVTQTGGRTTMQAITDTNYTLRNNAASANPREHIRRRLGAIRALRPQTS